MTESHDREIIGGHLLVIGGAEDKYNERRILRKFLSLAGESKAEVLIVPVASDFPEFAADDHRGAHSRGTRARARKDDVGLSDHFSKPRCELGPPQQ